MCIRDRYTFVLEISRLWFEPCINSLFDIVGHQRFAWCRVWVVRRMIKLLPVKLCEEMLRCSGSVWAGIFMNQPNAPGNHPTTLILNYTMQFCKPFATGIPVDCWALRKRSPEVRRKTLIWIFLCWRWSVPPRRGLLFSFRGCVSHACNGPRWLYGSEVTPLLPESCQKKPMNCPTISFCVIP